MSDYRTTARFLGKVGLEALAACVCKVSGWREELAEKPELDHLREFVRYNRGKDWPFFYRTLYPVNAVFRDGTTHYEVLHEYDLLYTQTKEIYIILALFGVEFSLNMGGPELDGYRKWLVSHEYESPLYSGKNAEQSAALEFHSAVLNGRR